MKPFVLWSRGLTHHTGGVLSICSQYVVARYSPRVRGALTNDRARPPHFPRTRCEVLHTQMRKCNAPGRLQTSRDSCHVVQSLPPDFYHYRRFRPAAGFTSSHCYCWKLAVTAAWWSLLRRCARRVGSRFKRHFARRQRDSTGAHVCVCGDAHVLQCACSCFHRIPMMVVSGTRLLWSQPCAAVCSIVFHDARRSFGGAATRTRR